MHVQEQFPNIITNREDNLQYLQIILRTTQDGFWVVNMSGQMVDINDVYCKMIGYTKDEFLKLTINDIDIEEKPEETKARIQRIKTNGYEIFETRHRCKNGTIIDVEVSVSFLPINNGEMVCFCRNITDRKKIAHELSKKTTLLSKVEAIARIGSWQIDLATETVDCSEELYLLFGIEQKNSECNIFTAIKNYIHPDDQERVFSVTNATLKDKIPRKIEFRILQPNGLIRWVYAQGEQEFDENGKLTALIGFVQDITERILSEKKLKTSEQELRDKNEKLKEINKDLERFIFMASHDLQAPLRRISGFSELILSDYGSKIPQEVNDFFRRIINSAYQMSEIMDGLISLSRIYTTTLKSVKINLSQLAYEIIQQYVDQEPERQIEIHIHDNLQISGDPSLMRLAMENLIENAWKFTSKTPNPRIEIGLTMQDNDKTYFVKDNGAGFDPKDVHKLFLLFERLHNPKEFKGTGIGLASVKKIIELHHGEIWAEGKVNEGAIFYFRLPE
jgi:PAS domain S-box-containing protein